MLTWSCEPNYRNISDNYRVSIVCYLLLSFFFFFNLVYLSESTSRLFIISTIVASIHVLCASASPVPLGQMAPYGSPYADWQG